MLTQVLVHNVETAESAFPVGVTDLSTLDEAQVAIWDPDAETTIVYPDITGGLGNKTGPNDWDVDRIQLVQGTAEDRPIYSTVFDTKNIKVNVLEHRAASSQEVEIDFTGTTLDFNGELTIKVTDLTEGNLPEERVNYSTDVSDGETLSDVLQRIVDDIESRTPNINGDYGGTVVSASLTGDAITLTSEDPSTIFDVAVNAADLESRFDPSLTYTITQTTDPITPTGEGQQILDHEESVRGLKGRHEVEDGILGSLEDPKTYADLSLNYDIYNFTFDGNLDIVKSAQRPQVLVAVEADTATLDDGVA